MPWTKTFVRYRDLASINSFPYRKYRYKSTWTSNQIKTCPVGMLPKFLLISCSIKCLNLPRTCFFIQSSLKFPFEKFHCKYVFQAIWNTYVKALFTQAITLQCFLYLDLGIDEDITKQRAASLSLASHGRNKLPSGGVGLHHHKAVLLMILWYLFSAFNLFANKYIITFLEGDPALLGNLP